MLTADSPQSTNEPDVSVGRPLAGRRGRRLVRTAVLVALTGIAGLVAARVLVPLFSPHLYSGTVLQGDAAAPSLDGLMLDTGQPADLADYRGELVLMFFGYASCPDVCPTTLATASEAFDQLSEEQQGRSRLLMVSVDPERDSLSQLGDYVDFFHPRFDGVTGDKAAINLAASQYGVFYELGDGDDYTVDHTASVMAIDPQGALRVIWPPDVTPSQLAGDMAELLS